MLRPKQGIILHDKKRCCLAVKMESINIGFLPKHLYFSFPTFSINLHFYHWDLSIYVYHLVCVTCKGRGGVFRRLGYERDRIWKSLLNMLKYIRKTTAISNMSRLPINVRFWRKWTSVNNWTKLSFNYQPIVPDDLALASFYLTTAADGLAWHRPNKQT